MKNNSEFDKFNRAMDTILKVKPGIVKRAMEIDKAERTKRRKAKKPSVARASTAKD